MSLILTFSPCDAHCSHFICSPAGFSLAQENSPLTRSPLSPQPHQLCLAFCLFLPPIRSLSRLSLPATFFSLPTHSLTSTVACVLQTPHKHPSSLYRTACLPRELNVFPSSSQNHPLKTHWCTSFIYNTPPFLAEMLQAPVFDFVSFFRTVCMRAWLCSTPPSILLGSSTPPSSSSSTRLTSWQTKSRPLTWRDTSPDTQVSRDSCMRLFSFKVS